MGLDTGRYIPSRRDRRVEKARGYECTASLIFAVITGPKPSRERGAQRASRANMNQVHARGYRDRRGTVNEGA